MCYCASHQPIAVQADSTLSTACENDTRLKKWQIGVIVLGVVIVVGACRSFVLDLLLTLHASRHHCR